MPEHRSHRLGAALKAADYAALPATVDLVPTWTATSNATMHHTSTAMGFRVVEHMHEVEAVIARGVGRDRWSHGSLLEPPA